MNRGKILKSYEDDLLDLPPPPPDPTRILFEEQLPGAIANLMEHENREKEFLKNLNEALATDFQQMKTESAKYQLQQEIGSNIMSNSEVDVLHSKLDCEKLKDECENFILPLIEHSRNSVNAALSSYRAFDQLNRLHNLLDQILTYQDQNYQMRKRLRDIKTLCELKKLQEKDINNFLNDEELSDTEFNLEYNAILAAGNSASDKRSYSKSRQKERSKSVFGEEISMLTVKDTNLNMPRRQSAFSERKSKVSKWTKVKAAFKWERANVMTENEGKSPDSGLGLQPVNNEVAKYLKVPQSIQFNESSADSVFSSSSGIILSANSSGIAITPGTLSSASSIEDINADERRRDSSKSDSRCGCAVSTEDGNRRSRSLDGDMVLSHINQNKLKTPWKKVKNIIQTHSGSFKTQKNKSNIRLNIDDKDGRDQSPCGSEGFDSTQQAVLSNKYLESQSMTRSNSSRLTFQPSSDEDTKQSMKDCSPSRILIRRSKAITDFESLPEDSIIDSKIRLQHSPSSPLNISPRMDSSDTEHHDLSYSPSISLKSPSRLMRCKKSFTSGICSVPSSPSRHSEFFAEFESEDMSSGDFSEPSTPMRKFSEKSSYQQQQEEINEKYIELKEKLNNEFEQKRQEWERFHSVCSASTPTVQAIKEEKQALKNMQASRMLEENLTADFKKKLHKWRVKKQVSNSYQKEPPPLSPSKSTEQKKIDWNLWKTGQLKLEGQGLTPLPDQKTLPEDFQKKLESWKKMKDTNTVPSYATHESDRRRSSGKFSIMPVDFSGKKSKDEEKTDKVKIGDKEKIEKLSKLKAIVNEPIAKEIEVQTSVGVMKFEGISRKFTRKLYEWEKARGIGPESSTFALLHPGYRPLDVGRMYTDVKSTDEETSILGRSLSLDSISPNPSMPSISLQTSSLSLNNLSEMKDNESLNNRRATSNIEIDDKSKDEPEAVIIEVEDEIEETALPLLTVSPIIEKQTPIYKYEQIFPNDIRLKELDPLEIASENNTNKICDEVMANASRITNFFNRHDNLDECSHEGNMKYIFGIICALNKVLPVLEKFTREKSPIAKNAMNKMEELVNSLMLQLRDVNSDEACCQEVIDEQIVEIEKNLKNLQVNVNLVCKYIKAKIFQHKVPIIRIASDNTCQNNHNPVVHFSPTVYKSEVVFNRPELFTNEKSSLKTDTTLDSSEDVKISHILLVDNSEEILDRKSLNRNTSNGSKKKLRLRRMGSRQNSKTDTDSDEDPCAFERRLKRRPSRVKKSSSIEEEAKHFNDEAYCNLRDLNVISCKSGQLVEQDQLSRDTQLNEENFQRVLISPSDSCVKLLRKSNENLACSSNIFIKTKRKIFSSIEDPDFNAIIAQDLESASITEPLPLFETKNSVIQNDDAFQNKEESMKSKEPSPLILEMVANYTKKIKGDGKNSYSGIRSPVSQRKEVLEEKNRYERNFNKIVKSYSAGLIGPQQKNGNHEMFNFTNVGRLHESLSIGNLTSLLQNAINDNDCNIDNLVAIASDSLRVLHKKRIESSKNTALEKKEHIYKKNKEKPTTLVIDKGVTSRKIDSNKRKQEYVWHRSASTSRSNDQTAFPLQPDKTDNTIPKITRKLESKALTPTEKSHPKHGDLWHPSISAPTTPLDENIRPCTPLTERAIKLRKAKEDFLRGGSGISLTDQLSMRHEKSIDKDSWRHYRLSQISVESSESSTECSLLKSASVGMIANEDETISVGNEKNFESLPRSVARSGKISSKLGFANLASKFRKVKMLSGREQRKMNAVSTLCRQSLVMDLKTENMTLPTEEAKDNTVMKSKSSNVSSFGTLFKNKDKEKINKSKSSSLL